MKTFSEIFAILASLLVCVVHSESEVEAKLSFNQQQPQSSNGYIPSKPIYGNGGGPQYPINSNDNGNGGQQYPDYNNNGNNNYFPPSGSSTPVAFSVVRASTYTLSSPSVVRFEKTLTDVGYGWDSQSSTFQCYYPGVYVFSWSGVSPASSQFRLALSQNGREVAFAWAERSGYQSGSNNVVLNLRQGDQIQLRVSEGKLYEPTSSRGYTTFSGYKIA